MIIVTSFGAIVNYNMTRIEYSVNLIDLSGLNYGRRTASYPEVSQLCFLLPIWTLALRRQSLVYRARLCVKTKRLRGRQGEGPFFLEAQKFLMNLSPSLSKLAVNENSSLHFNFALRLRGFFFIIIFICYLLLAKKVYFTFKTCPSSGYSSKIFLNCWISDG